MKIARGLVVAAATGALATLTAWGESKPANDPLSSVTSSQTPSAPAARHGCKG